MMRKTRLQWLAVFLGAAACSASPDQDPGETMPRKPDEEPIDQGPKLPGIDPSGGYGPGTCEEAIASKSYIGCEYWATVTSNSMVLSPFHFTLVASNSTSVDAAVRVEREGALVAEVTIPPSGAIPIPLPWVSALKQRWGGSGKDLASALVRAGAYHVTSSVPITLYQFNPLEYTLDEPPLCDGCFSQSNDASLLIPTTALGRDYFALSWPTLHVTGSQGLWRDLPGFVSVTATEDDTTVTVRSQAAIRAGEGVSAALAGAETQYALDRGDVLQLLPERPPEEPTPVDGYPCVESNNSVSIYCSTPVEFDMTGTRIVADRPVQVISGHDCTMVPYMKSACDHLEETMFPVETLGYEVVVTSPVSPELEGLAPYYLRVLSARDDNSISIEPPSAWPEFTLDEGAWTEIGPLYQDVRVVGTGKVSVAQYMVSASAVASVGVLDRGDPSESIGVPTEQFRTEYTFLASPTFESNFVNVVLRPTSTLELDGKEVELSSATDVGAGPWAVVRIPISGGRHTLVGSAPFGIAVYGYGAYTSYMYPGGLDLRPIEDVPK